MAAPKENTNAQKWTFDKAEKLLLEAIGLSNQREGEDNKSPYSYDFIGEVARDLDTYHHVFGYIVEQHPSLSNHLDRLKHNLEANCFYNTKKGNIKEATGIVNLKSNYKWTDRNHETHDGSIGINWIEEKTY